MSEGTSAAALPIGSMHAVRVARPSVAGMVGLSVLFLLLGVGNIVASAARVMDHDAPRAAPYCFALMSVAGLGGFVALMVQLAAVRRGQVAPARKLLAAPAGMAGLAAACALLVSTSVSLADKTWVRLALLAPGVSWAGVMLTVAAFALAFIALKRARTKVFDERGVTAVLLGIVLYMGCGLLVGTRFSDELVWWTLFPSAGGLIALAMLASTGPFDEEAGEETRRRAWWVIGLALGGVGCALATSWLIERSGGGMPGSHAELLARSDMALSCAWLLLAPVGAAAACCSRLYARALTLVLAVLWVALLVAVFPHMAPMVRDKEVITSVLENPAAVLALGTFALAGMLTLFALPWWIHAQSRMPSWLIAAGAPALTALLALGVHANAALAKTHSEEAFALHTEMWRLQGFWAAGAAGVVLLAAAMAALGLRASARTETGRAGWRGVLALVGGFVAAIALTMACAVWTRDWSGSYASVSLSLGPCLVGLVSIYLASRNPNAEDENASQDVLLAAVASIAGIAVAVIASEARLDLEELFASATRGQNEAMLSLLAPEAAPWLLTIPVLGAALVVMSAPGRWQAAAKRWKVLAAAVVAAVVAVGCLHWLESSAEQRVREGGRKHHALNGMAIRPPAR